MSQAAVPRAVGIDPAYPRGPVSHRPAMPDVAVERAERQGGRPRLAAIDGMRLFAALAVVGFHYVAAGPANWPHRMHPFPQLGVVFGYGWLGVNLFFLISGFVICMSSWGRGLGEFFVSRVVRLYPAYWVGVLLTTAVLTVLPNPIARQPFDSMLVNLTMLEEPLHVHWVDTSYWTLWREMIFYLLFAIVVWRGVTYRRAVLFCLLWTVASVLAVWKVPVLADLVGSEYSMYFVAGIAMYLMHRFRPTVLLWCIVCSSWALALHNLGPRLAYLSPGLGHKLSFPVTAALVTLCFVAVLAAALGWLDWARWRWLTVAGALTYPLYLIHQSIGLNLIWWLSPRVDKYLLVGGLVVGMLVLAWLIHRCVERPLAPLLKRGLQRSFTEIRRSGQETAPPSGR